MTAELSLLAENIGLLRQLGRTLHATGDDAYIKEESPATSSAAKHVRHVLNHYEALLRANSGSIDYETRERGTEIERDRRAALEASERLIAGLESWLIDLPALNALRIERIVRLGDGRLESVSYPSSFARELDFVHQHTVHHFALIAVILRGQGIAVPAEFGMSPATLRFQAANTAG